MGTIRTQDQFHFFKLAALVALFTVSAPVIQAPAAEQPKPGPEHKKLEARVGQWTYEGTSAASPFGPAGNFKGKTSVRMVLGGFFLEGREEDKGDTGYVYQGIYFIGYDPVTKTYFSKAFENDGMAPTGSTAVNGNTWTGTGTRADSEGKVYKTRSEETYSPDGKTSTFKTEYSPDDGKTWLLLWKGTMKKAKKLGKPAF